jgi:hypothetical protein
MQMSLYHSPRLDQEAIVEREGIGSKGDEARWNILMGVKGRTATDAPSFNEAVFSVMAIALGCWGDTILISKPALSMRSVFCVPRIWKRPASEGLLSSSNTRNKT